MTWLVIEQNAMSGATELIFVSACHNLPGVSEAESIGYYAPGEMERLRGELTLYIDHQLNLFSGHYSGYFLLAEYDHPADMIHDFEGAAFRDLSTGTATHAIPETLNSPPIRGLR
jgi:hypothetical protein